MEIICPRKYNWYMSTFIELSYIVTLLIGVACFTVHMTVRAKNLTAVSPLIKWKSTTAFLLLVMLFNICDFLIIYMGDILSSDGLDWIMVAENLLEVFLAYTMICMGKDYAYSQNPRWLDIIFVVIALAIFYTDSVYTLKGEAARENLYIAAMILLNTVPVALLVYFGIKYLKTARTVRSHQPTDAYMKIYNLVVIILCVIATASIIDSRTARDLIWWDKEIYVMFWTVFNVLNFVFVWRSCVVDDRNEAQRMQTTEDRLNMIAQQYGLSAREKEIAELIFSGKNNKEIASILYLSPNTIKVHASNLYRKLGAANRVQASAVLRGEEITNNIPETEEE